MEKFLTDFFALCDYPQEARASLLSDFQKLMANDACRDHFARHIEAYEKNGTTDFTNAYTEAGRLAQAAGMSPYPAELLIFCCFARHLRKMYAEKGYDDGIWLDSMLDLRTKLTECRKLHGIWGTFVAFWFQQFFTMERFAIGRLQYQLAPYYGTKEPYTVGNTSFIFNESRALELHIPSTGRLDRAGVTDSYRRAYEFFTGTEYIKDGLLLGECSSWLLYPGLEDTLSESSNVLDFKHDFDIVGSHDDENYGDCWRVFNKDWDHNATALPRDTDMQRRIADRLASGLPMGEGVGIIVFDGEKVLTRNTNI